MRHFVHDLLELNQHSSTVLRVQEHHRVAMSTNLRLRINGRDAVRLNLSESIFNVVDLQADVMHASTRVLHQIVGNGTLLSQGLQEFNVRSSKKDENSRHSVLGQCLRSKMLVCVIIRTNRRDHAESIENQHKSQRRSGTYRRSRDFSSENVAVESGRLLDVRSGDSDMVKLSKLVKSNRDGLCGEIRTS